MLGSRVHRGFWWLPENDTAKLAGDLTLEKGRATLSVLGSFGHEVLSESADEQVLSGTPRDVDRILGHTADGKAVTLESCGVTNFVLTSSGIPATTYKPSSVLVGAWFNEGENVTFDEISIVTPDLDTWVGVSGIATSVTVGDDAAAAHAFDIHFEPPEPISIPLDDGAEAIVKFSYRQSGLGPVPKEASVTQSCSFHLRNAEPFTLDAVGHAVGWVQNVLSLATGRPQTVVSVTGYIDELVSPSGRSRHPVELLWELPHNPEAPARPVHPYEMLFGLPQARPNISEVTRAWVARQDVLRPVFNLYFGMLYRPRTFLDVRFLAYAQAIETYDYRRRDATDLPVDAHEQRGGDPRECAGGTPRVA